MIRSVNYTPNSRNSKMQLLGVLTSQTFAGLSILTLEMNAKNFRSISQGLAILEKKL